MSAQVTTVKLQVHEINVRSFDAVAGQLSLRFDVIELVNTLNFDNNSNSARTFPVASKTEQNIWETTIQFFDFGKTSFTQTFRNEWLDFLEVVLNFQTFSVTVAIFVIEKRHARVAHEFSK